MKIHWPDLKFPPVNLLVVMPADKFEQRRKENREMTSDDALVRAVEEGYYADDSGNLFNPHGVMLSNKSRKKAGHLSVTLTFKDGYKKTVLAHRLIAYYHFRGEVFQHECVRHLNGIPWDNRLDNLKLGTHKENMSDVPKEVRVSNGKKQADSLVERSRRLSDNDMDWAHHLRDNGLSYRRVAEIIGVSTMTIYRLLNGQSWSEK